VNVEIVPEPSAAERAAILAALAQEADADEPDVQAPQEFLIKGEDSVRP